MKNERFPALAAAFAVAASLAACGGGGLDSNQTTPSAPFAAAPAPAPTPAPAPAPAPGPSAAAPVKKKILDYIASISGTKTLMGMHNKNSPTPYSDSARLEAITGKPAALWSSDFLFGSNYVNARPTMIAEAKKQFERGALVNLLYHACAPTRDEMCSWDDIGGANPEKLSEAQFKDLLTPGTTLHKNWIGRLDTLATYFQQLEDAGVVVMFRPFHEMNQCVFWWACHTGTHSTPALYRMTHDYLTKTKGLDNIIWVWNVQDFDTLGTDVDTYNPGNEYFDIASLDIYMKGYTDFNYQTMLRAAAGKPIAIGENQYVPTAAQLEAQPKWVFQMLWPDFIDDARNKAALPGLYASPNAVTLDKMPGWK